MFVARNLLKARNARQFSALTAIYSAPTEFKNVSPLEVVAEGQQVTLQQDQALQEHYERYNQGCQEELDMLSRNLIQGIEDSGAIAGWTQAEDDAFLSNEFTFPTSHEATWFMNEISKWCSENDHHPEWSLDGAILTVRLTSHFNNNKVSLLDYQLAKQMSFVYSNLKNARPYAVFQKTHAIEYLIGAGVVFCILAHRYWTSKYGDVPATVTVNKEDNSYEGRAFRRITDTE